jgi:hypothetical protein
VAEPVVLRLHRRELLTAHRQAVADGAIPGLVRELLAGHSGAEIACLLCDRPCADPPFLEVVDPGHDPFYVVGCVICADCAAVPPLVRVARCLRMLRKMKIRR